MPVGTQLVQAYGEPFLSPAEIEGRYGERDTDFNPLAGLTIAQTDLYMTIDAESGSTGLGDWLWSGWKEIWSDTETVPRVNAYDFGFAFYVAWRSTGGGDRVWAEIRVRRIRGSTSKTLFEQDGYIRNVNNDAADPQSGVGSGSRVLHFGGSFIAPYAANDRFVIEARVRSQRSAADASGRGTDNYIRVGGSDDATHASRINCVRLS